MHEQTSFNEKFGPIQLDVLKEIGNIGAGNAATSLSKLLNKKIDMQVPDVQIVGFDEVMELAGGADNEVVSVFLRIDGHAPGSMFFVLPPEQADRFVRKMAGAASMNIKENDPLLVNSALQELGNILSGAYLTALSDFTHLDLHPTVPVLSQDMVGAILSMGLLELSQVSDQAIVIETTLSEEEDVTSEVIGGHFFLFPDPDSYDRIFTALGVNL